MDELLREAFNMHQVDQETSDPNICDIDVDVNVVDGTYRGVDEEQPSDDAAKFYKLLKEMNENLYEGSKNSRLYFCIRLFHLKCMCGMTGKWLDLLIEFLQEFFPLAVIPRSSHESKKVIKDLGLGYEKIHICPNYCMLYWEHNEHQQSCHVCECSHWVSNDPKHPSDDDGDIVHKRHAKVLRYFPLIPRLQRIFMSSKTAVDMVWHATSRTNDGCLRCPADAEAWKSFDARYPDFASEPRNVRLGLSSDGFNPFKILSTSYSTWPVVLISYNLPPWIGMKQPSFILSMIIPGDKGPGNDIDIYLQPLIKELKQLWVGVQTFDASMKRNFQLRAALLWTINNFPAYANLSGWSTKGKYACPCCAAQTSSRWLSNGRNFCFMAHRRWLENDHPFRLQKHMFDGTIEMRGAPSAISGSNTLLLLKDLQFTYGKGTKCNLKKSKSTSTSVKRQHQASNVAVDNDEDGIEEDESHAAILWKKRSIFFELPYWEYNLLRHNLNVMLIEKNICENIVGTVLNVDGKSKDNLKSRLDLVELGIRRELHPEYLSNGNTRLPPASFSMSNVEKDFFCHVLRNIKVPDAYSSNVSKAVNEKERKLQGLKSHDYHILLHDLLPIALRSSMSKQVTPRHYGTFKYIQNPLWFLLKLKNYVRNKRFPEGSIAEGYLAEECVTFCSRYLVDVKTVFDKPARNLRQVHDESIASCYLFQSGGEPIGKIDVVELDDRSWAQAHRYVLLHHEAIEPFQDEYKNILRYQMRGRRSIARDVNRKFTETFHEWLGQNISNRSEVIEDIKFLSKGPNRIIKRYKGLIINGYRFHTKSRERCRRTQNSGVLVTSSTMSYASTRDASPLEGNVDYYGILTDIIELDYFNKFKVVLFRCDWADVTNSRGIKNDKYGFTMVNFSRTIHTGEHILDEPYVLSSQVKQVFYSENPKEPGWFVVIRNLGPTTECFPSIDEGIFSAHDAGHWAR
ncbi:uncharacterized protein LOC120253690 [Dioscorea cayenensis subsp. rotundata]|uniref:Uncharacterized protein LOC120253690 n=1 Tax=Dioscorea cayennensis subsp. rotundata TaxID=55577 RepID=A0AB40AS45_DIOCR|nr:uncharacterized protein LOC120253690 [Dioscorea cayenensis subsp. rotundata]